MIREMFVRGIKGAEIQKKKGIFSNLSYDQVKLKGSTVK